jgi:hypothetical protein
MKLANIVLFSGLIAGTFAFGPREAKADGFYNCRAIALYEGADYLQVECSNNCSTSVCEGTTTANFIGVNLSDLSTNQENRFVSMASAAILSGRVFRVYTVGTVCSGTPNCRVATTWALHIP